MPDIPKIRELILQLVQERGEGKTICPSEVARAVKPPEHPRDESWRRLMTPVRREAVRLAQDEKIAIKRKGKTQDPHGDIKGVIRLSLPDNP